MTAKAPPLTEAAHRVRQFVALWHLNPSTALNYLHRVEESVYQYRRMASQARAARHEDAARDCDRVADDEVAALVAMDEWMRVYRMSKS